MCQYFSCIVTKDLKAHWNKKTMNHDELRTEVGLEDKTVVEREYVKIEISPKDPEKVTRNRDDWKLRLDEERTLPTWYEKNVLKCQKSCWTAWEESVQINIAIEKEEKEGSDQLFFAYDSSKVVAYDSSKVEAYGSSKVVAYGSSKVEAHGSSKVEIKSDYAVVLCHKKIFVSEKTIVVKASIVKASEV